MAEHPQAPPGVGSSTPQQTATPTPPATPEARQQLKQGWLEYLARPEVQAGLFQFSIDVFQPPQPGQSTLGHIASSVAGGGQAIGRVQGAERARAEEKRKAGIEERETVVKEEDLDVRRGSTEAFRERTGAVVGTADADRAAAALAGQGKIEAAAKLQENNLAASLREKNIDVDIAVVRLVASTFASKAKALIDNAALAGKPATGLPTGQDHIDLYRKIAGAVKGEEPPPADTAATDRQIATLLQGNPGEVAAGEFALGKLPAERQVVIRQLVRDAVIAEDIATEDRTKEGNLPIPGLDEVLRPKKKPRSRKERKSRGGAGFGGGA